MKGNTSFPSYVSFTITNACNLRCTMCGQWSQNGYIRENKSKLKHELTLADWKKLVDEIDIHQIRSILLRGGEVFLFHEIMELIEYINSIENVTKSSISAIWNGEKADSFRTYRRNQQFPGCHRCVAKYMSKYRIKTNQIQELSHRLTFFYYFSLN